VCLNGSAPGANGFCPGPNICLLGGTCCPPGGETGTGTCCPQGQISMSDGTCVPFNSTIAKIVANEGLCRRRRNYSPTVPAFIVLTLRDTARPAQSPRLYRYRPTEVLCQGRPHAACPVSFRRQAAAAVSQSHRHLAVHGHLLPGRAGAAAQRQLSPAAGIHKPL
jgi:hypothetical protein